MQMTEVRKDSPKYNTAFKARVRVEPSGVGEGLSLNCAYFITGHGIVKIIQIVLTIVVMVTLSPPLTWFAGVFMFFVVCCFIMTLVLSFAHLITLRNALWTTFNWDFAEVVFTALATAMYFAWPIVHLVLTCRADYKVSLDYHGFFGNYIAAGTLGLVNFIAYGTGLFLLIREWRMSRQVSSMEVTTN